LELSATERPLVTGRPWPNRDASSDTYSGMRCDPLGNLTPRVGDPVCVLWLHTDHRQHEDCAGSVKREQLSAPVCAEAQEAGRVRRDLEISVTCLGLVGEPSAK
jgi:hypothetical protein